MALVHTSGSCGTLLEQPRAGLVDVSIINMYNRQTRGQVNAVLHRGIFWLRDGRKREW